MDLNKYDDTSYDLEYVKLNRINLECELNFIQADNLIKAGQIQVGIELLIKILQDNPEFGKAFNHLGWIYDSYYQNYVDAERCYNQSIKYAPDYSPAYLNYAYLLSSNMRYDELKVHLEKALTLSNIAKDKIYALYAFMSEMQHNLEAAMKYYVQAAMNTLDSSIVTQYREAIDRCKIKLELKNSLG